MSDEEMRKAANAWVDYAISLAGNPDSLEALRIQAMRTVILHAWKAACAYQREQDAMVCDDMVLYTVFDCAAAIRAGGK